MIPIARSFVGWVEISKLIPRHLTLDVQSKMTTGRAYHDLCHVGGIWKTSLNFVMAPDYKIMYAAVFHDYEYNIKAVKGENEMASNRAWLEFANSHKISSEVIEDVSDMILSTIDHSEAKTSNGRWFCDLDLSGLASDWDTFAFITTLIRKEHHELDDNSFWTGRDNFLSHMLRQPRIFRSSRSPSGWETRARRNIKKALDMGPDILERPMAPTTIA